MTRALTPNLALLLPLFLLAQSALALTPESVLIVANPNSFASLALADHYAHLRHIPKANILQLPFTPDRRDDLTTIETFREKLLKPVLQTIKDRHLEIDCIAWSADFPTAIEFAADVTNGPTTRQKGFTLASLNSLTFLYQSVLAKDPKTYASLTANHYYRPTTPSDVEPTIPFSHDTEYDGQKYLLSIVLGVTSGRGNSLHELETAFTRAASADFTNPKGTFYYGVNDNVRSTTRQPRFDPAIEKLKSLGIHAERTKDLFPKNKSDILGAMLGAQFPKMEEANSQTLPGAIVENLTSEGGIMQWGGGQTPVSNFIRNGAAGSSGTVTEPYAIAAKFPSPFLFYHYANGATLAEAFYLSVQGPYQLLIVGDPLCQPFAKRPATQPASTDAPDLVPADIKKILAAKPLPALNLTLPEGQAFVDGPFLTSSKINQPHIVEDMRRKPALQEARIPANADYKLEAFFDADQDDTFQFQIFTDGKTALTVDNTPLGQSTETNSWTFLPINLAKGKHKLEATGTAGPNRILTIRYGNHGTRDIGKRCHDFDPPENPSLHFAHIGAPPPPATAPANPELGAKK